MNARKRRAAMTGRAEATVAAPVDAVWQVIADVTRTGEWSHECRDVVWLDGAVRAAPGVRSGGNDNLTRWRIAQPLDALGPLLVAAGIGVLSTGTATHTAVTIAFLALTAGALAWAILAIAAALW
jgi:Polyketide cyclase / dehydrase and lipid transport